MDKREKITEMIDAHKRKPSDLIADKILALFPDQTKGIEWVGECDRCKSTGFIDEHNEPCGDCGGDEECNGIGTITRPATIDEVAQCFQDILRQPTLEPLTLRICLTINNGTLRTKESAK